MKKFLSLVLALVMTMSLVTITAGAKDFTDSSKVNYNEAVDVVSTCKIVDGYTDGAFNPQNTLTRGAAAKIICNMVLGPTTAAALGVDAKPFKDVAVDNVFAGYIAYCAKQGIINGYADGTFRPAGLVTGNQFMKMLLGALGYDGKIEGFTGANWTVNVMKLAKNISLDDGLTEAFVGSKAMNREEACLYAFNTLKATMVEYDSQTNITIGGTNVTVGNTKAKDMANTTNSDGKIKGDELMQFAEKYFTDLKKTGNNADDFGRPANEWKYKSTSIGTYADSGNLIGTYTKKVTKADLYTLVGKDAIDDLGKVTSDVGAATITYAANLSIYVDGLKSAAGRTADVDSLFSKNSSATAGASGKGVLTEVYMDDDNNVTVVEINTYVVQASEDYSTKNENVQTEAAGDTDTLLGAKKIDYKLSQDDFDVKGVKEDDYLLITIAQNAGNNYDVKSVTPAKMVEGKVTAYSTSNVTVGGTKYDYSKMTTEAGVQKGGFKINETAKVVLDSYGYIIAVDSSVVNSGKYVFIRKASDVNGLQTSVKAAAYFTDGTYKEITLKKVAGVTDTTTMAKTVGWFTYSVDSNDKYTLTKVSEDSKLGAAQGFSANDKTVMANGTATLTTTATAATTATWNAATTEGNKTVKANNSTVVMTLDSDDTVTVYTGVNKMPTIKTAAAAKTINVYYVYKDTGYATLVFVDMRNADNAKVDDASSSSADQFIYVMNYDSTNQDAKDNTYYSYNAYQDGKEISLNLDDQDLGDGDVYTLFVCSKTAASGSYLKSSDLKELGVNTSSDKYVQSTVTNGTFGYSDGVVTLTGSTVHGGGATPDYTLTSTSKVYLVVKGNSADAAINDMMTDDAADYEISEVSASYVKNTLKNYNFTGSVYAVKTDSDTTTTSVSALYVYVASAKLAVKSIAVKTAPAKVAYASGEQFAPAGLVITVTYADGSTADVTYAAGNASLFTFAPATITASGNVTITYGGKTVTQAVTVNP